MRKTFVVLFTIFLLFNHQVYGQDKYSLLQLDSLRFNSFLNASTTVNLLDSVSFKILGLNGLEIFQFPEQVMRSSQNFTSFISSLQRGSYLLLLEVNKEKFSSIILYQGGGNVNINFKVKVIGAEEFTIYPNPVSNGSITLHFARPENMYFLNIYDLSGTHIFSDEIKSHSIEYDIDVLTLTSGIYIFQVSNGKQTYTRRIQINE